MKIFVTFAVITLFFSGQALAQEEINNFEQDFNTTASPNADVNNSSLFGGNNTAFGEDPFNNTANGFAEDSFPSEGFGLENGNDTLFEADESASSNSLFTDELPQGNSTTNDIFDSPIPDPEVTNAVSENQGAAPGLESNSVNVEPVDPFSVNTAAEADPFFDTPSNEPSNVGAFEFSEEDFSESFPEETNTVVPLDPLANIGTSPITENDSDETTEPTNPSEGLFTEELDTNTETPTNDFLNNEAEVTEEVPVDLEDMELVTIGAETAEENAPVEKKVNGLTDSEREDVRVAIERLQPLPQGRHPEEYIVQPGDTLWDISDQLLDDPFWWPKLWSFNPGIMNPHIISPGQRIVFQPSDGVLPPGIALRDTGDFIPIALASGDFQPERNPLVDSWRDLDGTLVKMEDIPEFDLIDKYGGTVLTSRTFITLPGYISSEEPDALATVDRLISQNAAAGKGDIISTARDIEWEPQPGERFVTVRAQESIADPAGDREISQVWAYSGVVGAVETLESGRSKFVVEESHTGIRADDVLVPYVDLLRAVDTSTTSPSRDVVGQVVAIGNGDQMLASPLDVIHILPESEGPERGDLVALYSHIGGPPGFEEDVDAIPAGFARVVEVGESTAAAVVTKITREIFVGSVTYRAGVVSE